MKPYIDSGLREYPHIRTLIAVYCNPGRTLYVLCCPIHSSINHAWTGYRQGRTAITGLSNSCVPVIDAGTLDTAVVECINMAQCVGNW